MFQLNLFIVVYFGIFNLCFGAFVGLELKWICISLRIMLIYLVTSPLWKIGRKTHIICFRHSKIFNDANKLQCSRQQLLVNTTSVAVSITNLLVSCIVKKSSYLHCMNTRSRGFSSWRFSIEEFINIIGSFTLLPKSVWPL